MACKLSDHLENIFHNQTKCFTNPHKKFTQPTSGLENFTQLSEILHEPGLRGSPLFSTLIFKLHILENKMAAKSQN